MPNLDSVARGMPCWNIYAIDQSRFVDIDFYEAFPLWGDCHNRQSAQRPTVKAVAEFCVWKGPIEEFYHSPEQTPRTRSVLLTIVVNQRR